MIAFQKDPLRQKFLPRLGAEQNESFEVQMTLETWKINSVQVATQNRLDNDVNVDDFDKWYPERNESNRTDLLNLTKKILKICYHI